MIQQIEQRSKPVVKGNYKHGVMADIADGALDTQGEVIFTGIKLAQFPSIDARQDYHQEQVDEIASEVIDMMETHLDSPGKTGSLLLRWVIDRMRQIQDHRGKVEEYEGQNESHVAKATEYNGNASECNKGVIALTERYRRCTVSEEKTSYLPPSEDGASELPPAESRPAYLDDIIRKALNGGWHHEGMTVAPVGKEAAIVLKGGDAFVMRAVCPCGDASLEIARGEKGGE